MVSDVLVESRLTVDEVVLPPLPLLADDTDEQDLDDEDEDDDEDDEDVVEHEDDEDDDDNLELEVSAVVAAHGASAAAAEATAPLASPPPTVVGDDRWSVRHGTIVILARPADTLWWLALWLL